MNWRTAYHRLFAAALGLSLWAYAAYCFDLGRFYVPARSGQAFGPATPPWSAQRHWHGIDGPGGYACMAALILAGAGLLVLPAPPRTQEQYLHEARFEAAAKVLLIGGAGLFVLGIVLPLFPMSAASASSAQTVQQIQQEVLRDRQVLQRFQAAQGVWGALYVLLFTGLVFDLVLRYRAGREREL